MSGVQHSCPCNRYIVHSADTCFAILQLISAAIEFLSKTLKIDIVPWCSNPCGSELFKILNSNYVISKRVLNSTEIEEQNSIYYYYYHDYAKPDNKLQHLFLSISFSLQRLFQRFRRWLKNLTCFRSQSDEQERSVQNEDKTITLE